MGNPDPRYLSNQDYGRRLYVDNASYAEQMGVGSRKPAFKQNDALYAQSEFKKPYKEDDYEEMEYLADAYPGFPWDYDFDSPLEIPYPGEAYNPWHVRFLCFSDPCYGYGEEHCESLSCQWPVTGFHIHSKPAGCTTNFSPSQICAQCPEGETGWISFEIIMLATFQHNGATVKVEGRYYNMSMSRCIGLCDDSGIAYSAASDDTIARSGTAAIAITDSLGTKGSPYSWAVSGTGFTLDNAVTTGLTNTLNADATACGTATITITGCGSTTVTGYVRCTTGTWALKADACPSPGPHTYRLGTLYERVVGKTKVRIVYALCTQCAWPIYTCTECDCMASCVDEDLGNWCTTNMCVPFDCTVWWPASPGATQNCCNGVTDVIAAQCHKCDQYDYYEWECA